MNKLFDKQLVYSLAAEKEFAKVLEAMRFSAIRVKKSPKDKSVGGAAYEIRGEEYSAPDMIIFKSPVCKFLEVKHMPMCNYYPSHHQWRVEMNYDQYVKYCKFDENSRLKVMIGYCVDGGLNEEHNVPSPSGKFIQALSVLRDYEDDAEVCDINPPLQKSKDGQIAITNEGNVIEISTEEKKKRRIFWNIDLFEDLYEWGTPKVKAR